MIYFEEMRRWFTLIFALSLTARSVFAVQPALTNCAEIVAALAREKSVGTPFDLTARSLQGSPNYSFGIHVEDDSGTATLNGDDLLIPKGLKAGNVIRAVGSIIRWRDGRIVTDCTSFTILAPGRPPVPRDVSIRELRSGSHLNRLIRVRATVLDIIRDEIDPRYFILIISDETGAAYASCEMERSGLYLPQLNDATVELTGFCSGSMLSNRKYMGLMLSVGDINILRTAANPFNVPPIGQTDPKNPETALSVGKRLVRGRVVAVWQCDTAILKTERGEYVTALFADQTAPACGTDVDVVGRPDSNLYQIHLTRAQWRPTSAPLSVADDPTEDASVRELMTDAQGHRKIKVLAHGKPIRIRGEVRSVPPSSEHGERLYLQSEGHAVPIDISAAQQVLASVSPGCLVEVSGICVMDVDGYASNAAFPRIRGFFLVTRGLEDLRVVRRPPWWTTGRLIALIGCLFAGLVVIAVWNLLLHRVAERRGQALAAESLAHAESDLKVYERTRLAVELHDSIAQNLTGASLEIRSAGLSYEAKEPDVLQHLNIARKTIDSCRGELRNCIWDLRNQALEESDVDEAIRLILQPVLGDTNLTVRFNVPRDRISDNTIHAILSVIRELVTNAIRHGQADEIRIAGAIENGLLLFSVRDNGCGFDPDRAPGMEQGHFGLQGIRERLRKFNGQVSFDSVSGHGTRATVRIPLHPLETT